MLEDASRLVKKRLDGETTDRNSVAELVRIVERYDDPSSVDKLSLANTKVEEVRLKLNDNLTGLVQNQVNLDVGQFNAERRGRVDQNEEYSRPV